MTTPKNDIISTSPWLLVPGYLPRRIVVRDLASQYVVHMECQEDGPDCTSYSGGDYYRKDGENGQRGALSRAFVKFAERSMRLLEIKGSIVVGAMSDKMFLDELNRRNSAYLRSRC